MTKIEDKQAVGTQPDTSQGPVPGGSDHKPRPDAKDASEVDEIVADHQSKTAPKAA